MVSNDDRVIIEKIQLSLQSLVTDLEIEISELGSSGTETLETAQSILKDASDKLTSLVARGK